jgi:hypothetical protein
MSPALLDDGLAFATHFGVALYPWQREAFGRACRREGGHFTYRLAGASVPRGNGKSYGGATVGVWRLLCGKPPQDVISAALDYDGAKVVLDHARSIVRGHPALADAIEVQANGLYVPSTGSRWTITSREHTASRGRHPTLVIYDEVGWARDDELFSSLLAGQASVDDPLMLVISTVGRRQSGPLWSVKMLAEGGDPAVFWWHSSENLSPKVTPAFIERQRRILMPAQFARERQNSWVDAADGFTCAAEVDAAMSHGWTEQIEGRPGVDYHCFVDLGAVHDPTVIAVGHLESDIAFIDRLVTYQGSREQPVQLATVEQALRHLAWKFHLVKIRIESWQGLSAVQALTRAGLNAELFRPDCEGPRGGVADPSTTAGGADAYPPAARTAPRGAAQPSGRARAPGGARHRPRAGAPGPRGGGAGCGGIARAAGRPCSSGTRPSTSACARRALSGERRDGGRHGTVPSFP